MGLSRGLAELARDHEVNALVRPELAIQAHIDQRVLSAQAPDLLQIARETLSNAAKHAGPSEVVVTARADATTRELSISDNGAGFSPEAARVGRGLDNVRERAQALGGELDIDTAPGKGTTVRMRVPLPPAETIGY